MKNRSLLLVTVLVCGLVSKIHAQAIVGAWTFGDTTGDESGVLVFFSNGSYVHIEDAAPVYSPGSVDGFERGTFNWSGVNGTLMTSTQAVDTNNGAGLSGVDPATTTFSVVGDTLTITDPDGLGSGSNTLSRVTGASPIVGAWYLGDITATQDSAVIVFMANNTFFMMTDQPFEAGSPNGMAGMERGTYTWNSGTLAFSSTVLADTNGMFGLSHPPLLTSAEVIGSSLYLTDTGGTNVLTNVAAVPEPSTWALLLTGSAFAGFAAWRRRRAA